MSHKGMLGLAVLGVVFNSALAQDALDPGQQQPAALDQAVPVSDDIADELPGQAAPTLDQTVPVAEQLPDETPDQPLNDEQLLAAEFQRYQQLVGEGILDEADNVAKRVVELAIRISGPTSTNTARALTNLAIVQHRNGQYDAAQQNYEAAIDIIEAREDRLNPMLINPLQGLGAAQLEGGRPDLAAQTFGRAVHVTHVNDGPHNMGQLELLESLAETNLRMGLVEEAKQVHDNIYTLNLRHYRSNPMDMVPSLMRRASWQHRTGYIIDERATYRRIIRIIESQSDKNDVRLVQPLTKLGQSYFYIDTSGIEQLNQPTAASGEIYFKRALRIAQESEDSDWKVEADAMLALGDYYLFRGTLVRANSLYEDAWELLSGDDEKLSRRVSLLGKIQVLRFDDMPRYTGAATAADNLDPNEKLREGTITFTYGVSPRGKVTGFKVVEANPPELYDIQRRVQREMRSRLYRPRYVDGAAVATEDLSYTHRFYYRQSELDAIRDKEAAAEAGEEET